MTVYILRKNLNSPKTSKNMTDEQILNHFLNPRKHGMWELPYEVLVNNKGKWFNHDEHFAGRRTRKNYFPSSVNYSGYCIVRTSPPLYGLDWNYVETKVGTAWHDNKLRAVLYLHSVDDLCIRGWYEGFDNIEEALKMVEEFKQYISEQDVISWDDLEIFYQLLAEKYKVSYTLDY